MPAAPPSAKILSERYKAAHAVIEEDGRWDLVMVREYPDCCHEGTTNKVLKAVLIEIAGRVVVRISAKPSRLALSCSHRVGIAGHGRASVVCV